MTDTASRRSGFRSIAGVTLLPILMLALLFGLGRGLKDILAEGQPFEHDRVAKARHVSARPAEFGTERALADRAAALAEIDVD